MYTYRIWYSVITDVRVTNHENTVCADGYFVDTAGSVTFWVVGAKTIPDNILTVFNVTRVSREEPSIA